MIYRPASRHRVSAPTSGFWLSLDYCRTHHADGCECISMHPEYERWLAWEHMLAHSARPTLTPIASVGADEGTP